MSQAPRAIVFTDLDGTLLDHETYSSSASLPGIRRLREHGIPLLPATSKTLAELVPIVQALDLDFPVIVENGAAVVWQRDPVRIESIQVDYKELCGALRRMAAKLDLPLVGFADVDVEEVARRTRLPRESAIRAMKRYGDEPFWSERRLDDEEMSALRAAVRDEDLRLTKGGRFFHLHGKADKGTAVRKVVEVFRKKQADLRTAAFGDSANDRPMLAVVDRPYAVRKSTGGIHPSLASVPGLTATKGTGPRGFTEGVETLLELWRDLLVHG